MVQMAEITRYMSTDNPDDARALAGTLLKDASEQIQRHADLDRVRELVRVSAESARANSPSVQLSQAQLRNLVAAVEHDLGHASDNAKLDEERLTKLETQTRILSEAVIAISETAEGVAPAVRLLKAGIEDADPTKIT
jgi:hypothetical protein